MDDDHDDIEVNDYDEDDTDDDDDDTDDGNDDDNQVIDDDRDIGEVMVVDHHYENDDKVNQTVADSCWMVVMSVMSLIALGQYLACFVS